MAIAVSLDEIFDIETFSGLVQFIINHLELDTETAAQVPNFIRLAEYRLDRLLTVPQRETKRTRTLSGDTLASLPWRSIHYVEGPDGPIPQMSLDGLIDLYGEESGSPCGYAQDGETLVFRPIPPSSITVTLSYMTRIPPLSTANPTNWLLQNNADAYVYGALWQACAWLEDIDAATAFRAELMSIIPEVNQQAMRYRFNGPLVPRLNVP